MIAERESERRWSSARVRPIVAVVPRENSEES
jgi:hypothetical protein